MRLDRLKAVPGRDGERRRVAEDAGQAPHVLRLQVGPGVEPGHADFQPVAALAEQAGDVELVRQAGALGPAQDMPAEADQAGGVGAVPAGLRTGLRVRGTR